MIASSPVAYMIVGIITGLSLGLFGIGGALIGTPLLRVLAEMPPLLAVATPLPVVIPSAVSGAVMYWRRGYVDRDLVVKTLRLALPMTVIGALVTHWTAGVWLMATTAVVLVYTGLTMVQKRTRDGLHAAVPTNRRINVHISAAGFLAGFLAIGGGIVLVPVYVRWLGVPIHRALATSLVCVAAMAIPGTLVHGVLGHIAWGAVVFITLTAIPASWLGARIALQLKGRALELSYGILLAAFGAWFFLRSLWTQ